MKNKITVTEMTAAQLDLLIGDLEYAWTASDDGEPAMVEEVLIGASQGDYTDGHPLVWTSANLLMDLLEAQRAL